MVNELYHHGIKGQKWGIRRYRNPDGSLTPAGQKRYGSMSGKKLHKTLKKEFIKERVRSGHSRWDHTAEIGEHGKGIRTKQYEGKVKPALDEWNRSFNKADKKWSKDLNSGKISYEEYDRRIEKYNKKNKPRVEKLTRKYKKDLTLARIQDLGYSKEVSRNFCERMLKEGYLLDFL